MVDQNLFLNKIIQSNFTQYLVCYISFRRSHKFLPQIFCGCLVKQQIIYDEKSLKVLKGKPSNFLLVNGHFGYRKARSFFTIKSEIIQFKGKHSLKTHAINLVKLSLKMFILRIIDNKGHFDIRNNLIFILQN